MNANLQRARTQVRAYQRRAIHEDDPARDDALLDELLCLPGGHWRRDLDADTAAARRHPGHSVVNVATPYPVCRGLIEALRPGPDDVLLDMGCGDGRVVVYGALACHAEFRGVELVAERAGNGQRAIQQLKLTNASIVQGDARDQPLDDVTMIYAFRSFSVEVEADVLAQLEQRARRGPLSVALYRMPPSTLDPRLFSCISAGALCIFRSR